MWAWIFQRETAVIKSLFFSLLKTDVNDEDKSQKKDRKKKIDEMMMMMIFPY